MKKEQLLVGHTNDWSIDSKRSMVELGYFKDDFIKYFSKKKRRSPLINMCYYVRAYVIDKALKYFMSSISSNNYQVVSLGAGFDTTYFRLFSNDKNVRYIEIDLLDVVKNKIDILINNDELKSYLGQYSIKTDQASGKVTKYYLSSKHYDLFSQNLSKINELNNDLKSINIDFSLPTVFLSEVAITYMEEKSCDNLCKFLSESFPNAAFLVYEQINPEDGFGQVMMQHFVTIQNPLKSLTRYNTCNGNIQYYINAGWKDCKMFRVLDLYDCTSSKEEFMSKLEIEPFDEWEEFHLTCLHYALYIACNGPFCDLVSNFCHYSHLFPSVIVEKKILWSSSNCNRNIERFSHSLINKEDSLNIIFGGVGVENNCHKKNSLLQIVDAENNTVSNVQTQFNEFAQSYMATCTLENMDCFLIHGGCKSPSREGDDQPYIISFENNSFSLMCVSIEENCVKPGHRWRHTALSLGLEVFIFGGRNHKLEIFGDFWKLCLNKSCHGWTGSWIQLESGPSPRFSHGASSNGDSLVISGGLDSNFKPLSDIWIWQDSWKRLNVSSALPRYGHTSHIVETLLFLVGGVTFHSDNPIVSIIDLNTCTARHFTITKSLNSSIMLHNHQSILSADQNNIKIIGGGGNCFSFGTSFNHQIITIPISEFKKLNHR